MRITRALAVPVFAVVLAFAAAPAAALAADTPPAGCEATAIRVALLGGTPLSLTTAKDGSVTCVTDDMTVLKTPDGLTLPIAAGVVEARTAVASDRRTAYARAGVANLQIGLGNSVSAIVDNLLTGLLGGTPTQTASAPGLGGLLGILGAGSSSSVAVTPDAIQAALKQGLEQLISSSIGQASLLGVEALRSEATTTCNGTSPVLAGQSVIAGLSVLGQKVALDPVVGGVLNVLNTQQLSQLNVASVVKTIVDGLTSSLGLTPLLSNPLLAPVVTSVTNLLYGLVDGVVQPIVSPILKALQPLLDKLVTITVKPSNQVVAGGKLTQQALSLGVTLLGRPLLDVTLGEAISSLGAVSCAPTEASSYSPGAKLALECSGRKVMLIDVLERNGRTYVRGVADHSLVGRRATIRLTDGSRKVGTPLVHESGYFAMTTDLPPAAIRATNRARFQAQVGRYHSQKLKFRRRMQVTQGSAAKGTVALRGHVSGPLDPSGKVRITQQLSCKQQPTVVASVTPAADGTWTVRVKAPKDHAAAIYRAQTNVRKHATNPKLFPTFTLPTALTLIS